MNMRRRRSSQTSVATAAAAAATATDSVSPPLDSGATSPDVIPAAAAETRTASIEVTVGEAAVPPPIDKGESCAEPGSNSRGRRSYSYRLRRGQKDGAERDRGGNRPAGVHMRHHGRGGSKEKGWRSMHMVQCLRYHEVRAGVVWWWLVRAAGP